MQCITNTNNIAGMCFFPWCAYQIVLSRLWEFATWLPPSAYSFTWYVLNSLRHKCSSLMLCELRINKMTITESVYLGNRIVKFIIIPFFQLQNVSQIVKIEKFGKRNCFSYCDIYLLFWYLKCHELAKFNFWSLIKARETSFNHPIPIWK